MFKFKFTGKLGMIVPGQPLDPKVTVRNKASTASGAHVYDTATIEYYEITGTYYAICKDVRYLMTPESFNCAGHIDVWSTFRDSLGAHIRVVRFGRDRYYSAKGFLPFKAGHKVCGRIVKGIGGKMFDVVVNATACSNNKESIQSAYSFMKRFRKTIDNGEDTKSEVSVPEGARDDQEGDIEA